MTDREGPFSKGRNPNSSQPLARPLTFKYRFCQAGERKKTLAVLCLSFKTLKCYDLKWSTVAQSPVTLNRWRAGFFVAGPGRAHSGRCGAAVGISQRSRKRTYQKGHNIM
jgi:hypothetical protein